MASDEQTSNAGEAGSWAIFFLICLGFFETSFPFCFVSFTGQSFVVSFSGQSFVGYVVLDLYRKSIPGCPFPDPGNPTLLRGWETIPIRCVSRAFGGFLLDNFTTLILNNGDQQFVDGFVKLLF